VHKTLSKDKTTYTDIYDMPSQFITDYKMQIQDKTCPWYGIDEGMRKRLKSGNGCKTVCQIRVGDALKQKNSGKELKIKYIKIKL